ncbi:MAG: thioredoxin domain-containing protein [Ferrovibrio sp.]|uniref:thioredoxin domain-containing protein n=1 Tax=Ferrovibrio sp. TaxID=1917215 RepID=UPI002639BC98|nr:thioredoxin domain-containing protein [Ferrovibrio sp.]MCW0233113.1 thioredoxin domain-containing protein [Ferrovibrio sp.]
MTGGALSGTKNEKGRNNTDRNNLDRAASPYLQQHRDNPVHWQVWGPEALAAAQDANKPILLSIGYAACHWCHVMAHESFENPEIAAVMNELFVNIKVDREERPDIDTIYMNALQVLGEQGGWPLTMFLTPKGEPFWGGTYFPPESRYGRPGFREVLEKISEAWHQKPDAIAQNTRMLVGALRNLSKPQSRDRLPLSNEVLDQVAAQVLGHVDPDRGGIGTAPKFPQTGLFDLLWRAYLRTGIPDYSLAVVTTIMRMAQGGIYDHLGGGFARYSTDAEWLAPHFEKMLYDNAQLLSHMALVEAETHDAVLRQRIMETVGWLLREMLAQDSSGAGGAFAATQDADSEGEEGRFYVWDKAEVAEILGPYTGEFCAAYDVTEDGNWEHSNILRRSLAPDLKDEAGEKRLKIAREKLFTAREKRIKPGWDDKVLADWNGLMIASLADLSQQYAQPAWLAAAERAYSFIVGTLQQGEDRLGHSWRNDILVFPGLLDDYANMSAAALALFEATGNPAYLEQAKRWLETVESDYADPVNGGYFFTSKDAEDLVTRTRHAADNATPAGNGMLVGVFARLWYLTGELVWRERAQNLIDAFSPEIGRNFFPMGSFLNGVDLFLNAVQVAIIGRRGEAATDALVAAAYTVSIPNRVVLVTSPDATLPDTHPAIGKTQIDGKPTAYVCLGPTCGLPVTTPAELAASLKATRAV